jgi:hypothetical protein
MCCYLVCVFSCLMLRSHRRKLIAGVGDGCDSSMGSDGRCDDSDNSAAVWQLVALRKTTLMLEMLSACVGNAGSVQC